MFHRLVTLLTTSALLALLQACATPLEAVTDHDDAYDFSGVKTIAIQPVSRTDPGAIMISDMQVARVNEALSSELQRKGFDVVDDNAKADMLMTWHLVTQDKTDVRSYNSMSYYNCWRCGPMVNDISVRQYTQGTLIVDLIDPQRNQSVWRSTVSSRLQAEPSPEDAAARRQEAATAIFSQFPPL